MSAAVTKQDIQCLTFDLDEETFAVEVHRVREVLDPTKVTKIPRAPDFLLGIINVRGNVIPVVDLHKKLGMPHSNVGNDSRIVVLEADLDGEITTLGALADAVREVTDLNGADIEPAPKIGSRWKSEFIEGIGKLGEDFVILLNIDRVFSSEELAYMQDVSGEDTDDTE
ncbi:MAG: chemotaxis protein CheW [Pontiellaceae bacterium]|nr:chemotaxis protein CheW [Pontiellaceae bacterium]MBN2785902.1 chemotaxis protein CheW [Pontiellaceae bacterium]